MANRTYGYQYGTSPRKLETEYKIPQTKKKKVQTKKSSANVKKTKSKKKSKQKKKLSFEIKFFINSMLFFSIIFAIIACQAMVDQKYKEREKLKKEYNELLAVNMATNDISEDARLLASQYGMQTKSATLINLDTTDYIESSTDKVEIEDEKFFDKILNWFKSKF